MTTKSRQKFKYLENKKRFYDEMKNIFLHVERAFMKVKKFFLEGESPILRIINSNVLMWATIACKGNYLNQKQRTLQ